MYVRGGSSSQGDRSGSLLSSSSRTCIGTWDLTAIDLLRVRTICTFSLLPLLCFHIHLLAPVSVIFLPVQLCILFFCQTGVITSEGAVNKRVDATLDGREHFDSIFYWNLQWSNSLYLSLIRWLCLRHVYPLLHPWVPPFPFTSVTPSKSLSMSVATGVP